MTAGLIPGGGGQLYGRLGHGRPVVREEVGMRVLVVDAANVVGSRPDGWWRDRAGAARRLHSGLVAADLPYQLVVLVLEGRACPGVLEGRDGAVLTVHAPGSGDDELVAQCRLYAADEVTLVTADRGLIARVAAFGTLTIGPRALLDRLSAQAGDPEQPAPG